MSPLNFLLIRLMLVPAAIQVFVSLSILSLFLGSRIGRSLLLCLQGSVPDPTAPGLGRRSPASCHLLSNRSLNSRGSPSPDADSLLSLLHLHPLDHARRTSPSPSPCFGECRFN